MNTDAKVRGRNLVAMALGEQLQQPNLAAQGPTLIAFGAAMQLCGEAFSGA